MLCYVTVINAIPIDSVFFLKATQKNIILRAVVRRNENCKILV